jgi:hypothetical protein
MTFEAWGPLLKALEGVDVDDTVDLPALAARLELDEGTLTFYIEQLAHRGLVLLGDVGDPPLLRRAGSQYIQLRGEVNEDVLHFLPHIIDDLHARAALLAAGSVLVDEFRDDLLHGRAAEHASWVVPAAFAEAFDERRAIDLFAASVSLMARLSAEERPGCVAEEVLAVRLQDKAKLWLAMQVEEGELRSSDAEAAAAALWSLYELMDDDDVLLLFEMKEPADAAVEGQAHFARHMGRVDQRFEAWFRPFGGTAATGYLDEPVAAEAAR